MGIRWALTSRFATRTSSFSLDSCASSAPPFIATYAVGLAPPLPPPPPTRSIPRAFVVVVLLAPKSGEVQRCALHGPCHPLRKCVLRALVRRVDLYGTVSRMLGHHVSEGRISHSRRLGEEDMMRDDSSGRTLTPPLPFSDASLPPSLLWFLPSPPSYPEW